MRMLLLATVLLLGAAPAAAQQPRVGEMTPTIGLRAGGSLRDVQTGETFSIQPSWSWGFVAGLSVGPPNLFIEGTYLQQLSRAAKEDAFGGAFGGMHDLRLQTALAGAQWDFAPAARVRPFVSAGFGASSLEAQGGGHTTLFTAALSGGVKLMASPGFGLRVQLRALALFAGGSPKDLCQWSECEVELPGWGTLQADLSLGAFFSF